MAGRLRVGAGAAAVIGLLSTMPVSAANVLRLPVWLKSPPPRNMSRIPVQSCCKHCRKGKACGNTCISQNDECYKDAGCACDG